jgi:hypothetical protein
MNDKNFLLTGSEKQVVWAKKIVSELAPILEQTLLALPVYEASEIAKVSNKNTVYAALIRESTPKMVAILREKIEAALANTSAAWWIDNRDITKLLGTRYAALVEKII